MLVVVVVVIVAVKVAAIDIVGVIEILQMAVVILSVVISRASPQHRTGKVNVLPYPTTTVTHIPHYRQITAALACSAQAVVEWLPSSGLLIQRDGGSVKLRRIIFHAGGLRPLPTPCFNPLVIISQLRNDSRSSFPCSDGVGRPHNM